MTKKKLKSKAEFKDDLARITVLKDRIKEIKSRYHAMQENERIEIEELNNQINKLKNG